VTVREAARGGRDFYGQRGTGGRPRPRRRVGRPERPLDPHDGPLARFAGELRQLRAAAGYPSYRTLATTALFAPSVLSTAAGGISFPSLQVTLAYARACGGDEAEWHSRWQSAAATIRPGGGVPGRHGRTER
jgi:hypothetical protein